ncbi:SIR2 family protein [Mesorhizobium sp.]|uniref:SIR2 family NAD-dependent protein deacylase n=1 Tax=Mesorhizobium sp. TaxID=1871066 RepID=UPI00338ED6A6
MEIGGCRPVVSGRQSKNQILCAEELAQQGCQQEGRGRYENDCGNHQHRPVLARLKTRLACCRPHRIAEACFIRELRLSPWTSLGDRIWHTGRFGVGLFRCRGRVEPRGLVLCRPGLNIASRFGLISSDGHHGLSPDTKLRSGSAVPVCAAFAEHTRFSEQTRFLNRLGADPASAEQRAAFAVVFGSLPGELAMPSALEQLAQSVKERRAILFVGAGVSMSVGLPSWEKLIEHMVDELGLDRDVVDRPESSYQALAEYYRLKHGSLGPLRSWMDREWSVSREKVKGSAIHKLIVSLDFPIIYTTNYDRNLEVAFEVHDRAFVKVANAKDIPKVNGEVTQIIKYHGDFDDDASLVLAESDYFGRLSFESPLDVKFRADALGRTVLFIGYSMSDMNIRLLLYRLWETWRRSGYEKNRPKSFVFMPQPSVVQEAVLGRWGIDMLTEEADRPEDALVAFLSKLRDAIDQV